MQKNKMSVLVLLLVLIVAIGPVSAAPVNPSMTNAQIQSIINNAASGSTITFASGNYNGISLNITKPLKLVSNGVATLIGTGNDGAVFNVLNTTGVSINGFTINGSGDRDYICFTNVNSSSVTSNTLNNNANSTTAVYIVNGYNINVIHNTMNLFNYGWNTGIAAKGIYGGVIANNTILNGGEGMNIYQAYRNLTISGNSISHMATHYGDGISMANCGTPETSTSTTVSNNKINDTAYGIFIGGNFRGTVSSNNINNSQTAGMNITGKQAPTSGNLYANITYNSITNAANIGIAMEHPDVIYLNLSNNIIGSTVNSGGYSILTNSYYTKDPSGQIYVTYNNFNNATNAISQALINSANIWSNNT